MSNISTLNALVVTLMFGGSGGIMSAAGPKLLYPRVTGFETKLLGYESNVTFVKC